MVSSLVAKRASSVIVTTKNDLVRFREHVPRYNNGIYVLPNWVDVNEFRPRNNLVNPREILFIRTVGYSEKS